MHLDYDLPPALSGISRQSLLWGLLLSLLWLAGAGAGVYLLELIEVLRGSLQQSALLGFVVTVPLLLIWLLVGMERRAEASRQHIDAHFSRIKGMIPTPEASESYVNELNASFRAEIEVFQDTIEGISKQFDRITEKFDAQQRKLEGLGEYIGQQNQQIEVTFNKQAEQIERNAAQIKAMVGDADGAVERARSLRVELETSLTRPVENLQEAAGQVTIGLNKQMDSVEKRLVELNKLNETTHRDASAAREGFRRETEDLRRIGRIVVDDLEKLSKQLNPHLERLDRAAQQTSSLTESVRDQVDTQVQELQRVSKNLGSQAEVLTTAVRDQVQRLDYLKGTVDDYGATINEQFQKQIDGLLKASGQAGESMRAQIQDSADAMKRRMDEQLGQVQRVTHGLESQLRHIGTEVEASVAQSVSAFDGVEAEIRQASEQARLQIEHLIHSFSGELKEGGEEALVSLMQVGREIPKLSETLADTAERSALKVQQAHAAILEESSALRAMGSDLDGFQDSIGRARDDLAQVLNETKSLFAVYQQTADNLHAGGQVIDEAMQSNLQTLHTRLEEARTLVSQAFDAIEQERQIAGDGFRSHNQEIEQLTKKSRDEIGELQRMSSGAIKAVRATSDSVAGQLRDFESQLVRIRQQIEAAAAAGARATGGSGAAPISGAGSSQQERDAFLTSSYAITGQLQEIGLDIYALMEQALTPEVLDSYRRNPGSAARDLAERMALPEQAERVQQHYQSHSEFRSQVNRYLALFAELLGDAQRVDPSQALFLAFISSDVGRIYTYLDLSLEPLRASA